VVSRVLDGARDAGARTEILYLVDESPEYCVHCGHSCFEELDCPQEDAATLRSQRVDEADAVVLGAPVYVWQINGLTAALLDKVRLSTGPWTRGPMGGKPGLGIAVAGGTGTGVFSALQSLYAWLCLWKFRALEPLPVTRFNLQGALDAAQQRGHALVDLVQDPQPFSSIAQVLLYYDSLPYCSYGRLGEFRWLAQQVAEAIVECPDNHDQVTALRDHLARGEVLWGQGKRDQAAPLIVAAYQAGREAFDLQA
jgi:NAD(P)H-dependent FMN reductase